MFNLKNVWYEKDFKFSAISIGMLCYFIMFR